MVPVGEEPDQILNGLGGGAVRQGQGRQQGQQGGLGVVALFGGGAVGVLAAGLDAHAALGGGNGVRDGGFHAERGNGGVCLLRRQAWALGGTMFSRGPPVKDETRGSAASWGQAARKVG